MSSLFPSVLFRASADCESTQRDVDSSVTQKSAALKGLVNTIEIVLCLFVSAELGKHCLFADHTAGWHPLCELGRLWSQVEIFPNA